MARWAGLAMTPSGAATAGQTNPLIVAALATTRPAHRCGWRRPAAVRSTTRHCAPPTVMQRPPKTGRNRHLAETASGSPGKHQGWPTIPTGHHSILSASRQNAQPTSSTATPLAAATATALAAPERRSSRQFGTTRKLSTPSSTWPGTRTVYPFTRRGTTAGRHAGSQRCRYRRHRRTRRQSLERLAS